MKAKVKEGGKILELIYLFFLNCMCKFQNIFSYLMEVKALHFSQNYYIFVLYDEASPTSVSQRMPNRHLLFQSQHKYTWTTSITSITLFWCLYCWLWTRKCRLAELLKYFFRNRCKILSLDHFVKINSATFLDTLRPSSRSSPARPPKS